MIPFTHPAEPRIPLRWRAHLVPLYCIAGGLFVLMARRTDQLTDAQVWVEEGAASERHLSDHAPLIVDFKLRSRHGS